MATNIWPDLGMAGETCDLSQVIFALCIITGKLRDVGTPGLIYGGQGSGPAPSALTGRERGKRSSLTSFRDQFSFFQLGSERIAVSSSLAIEELNSIKPPACSSTFFPFVLMYDWSCWRWASCMPPALCTYIPNLWKTPMKREDSEQ